MKFEHVMFTRGAKYINYIILFRHLLIHMKRRINKPISSPPKTVITENIEDGCMVRNIEDKIGEEETANLDDNLPDSISEEMDSQAVERILLDQVSHIIYFLGTYICIYR